MTQQSGRTAGQPGQPEGTGTTEPSGAQPEPAPASTDPDSYPAPPPPRSAYPSAAEGGFGVDLDLTPPDDVAPGAGYGGQDDGIAPPTPETTAPAGDRRALFIGLAAALVLAAVTLVGLVLQPIVVSVVAILGVVAAGVFATRPVRAPRPAGQRRRTILIAAVGPVLVLAFYWISALVR